MIPSSRRFLAGVVPLVALLAGASCENIFMRSCERGHFATVVTDPPTEAVIYPGETMPLRGSLSTGDRNMQGENCAKLVYNSITAPERFTWWSTDTTVATVSDAGVVTGRALGKTTIWTLTSSHADSLVIQVGPPVASLRITAMPLEAKTGDTVTVTVEPLDAGGNLVEHAVLAGPIKLQDYPDRPWVNVDATGLSGKFIMPETGNVRVIWTVVHGPTPSILASVTVTRR